MNRFSFNSAVLPVFALGLSLTAAHGAVLAPGLAAEPGWLDAAPSLLSTSAGACTAPVPLDAAAFAGLTGVSGGSSGAALTAEGTTAGADGTLETYPCAFDPTVPPVGTLPDRPTEAFPPAGTVEPSWMEPAATGVSFLPAVGLPVVPEPAAALLSGLAGLLALRRRAR